MALMRAILLFTALACVSASVLKASKGNILRLPRSIDLSAAHSLINEPKLDAEVVPTGYKLELEPYIEDGIFKGRVLINVSWAQESKEISMHAHQDLQILQSDVRLKVKDASNLDALTPVPVARLDRNPKRPIFTVRLGRSIPKGSSGEIEMAFEGRLETESSEGFFRTSYESEEKSSYIIGLNLRPNNARRVFPCFDEPGYKTPFQISVVRPKHMTALSNMPVVCTEEVEEEPLSVWDHFDTTPPLSTFAIGIVISDLSVVNTTKITTAGCEIEISIWARKDFLAALDGVMDKVIRIYQELAEFWDLPLPIKKLNLVALPNYQGVKPADSWGLIVFKESELSSRGYLQLSQELNYQWLGGLVTPAWWSDAHVNKALVSYVAASTTIKIDNGVEMDGKWPMTILYSLYYEFSKRYPHSRITGMKQETTCSKIELLFRMLNYTLGEKTFKKGLQNFINKKKYETFTSDTIWDSLNEVAVQDSSLNMKDMKILDIAYSWMTKDRLPVVNVQRNYEKKTAVATQRVYLRERPHDVPGQDKLIWWIPLVIVKQNNLKFCKTLPTAWMKKEKEVVIKDMPSKDQFIIVNPEEIGPFPVNYDVQNWNMLAQFLVSEGRTTIPINTRAKLLHDAWNLAYAGDLSFATALNMTLFLRNERDHLVWDPVFTMIDHIGRHIDSSDVHKKFETYVRMLLTPLYEELNANASDSDESWKITLRTLSKSFLCKAGYRPCIEEAQAAFKKWMDAENPDEGNPVPNQYICPVFKWGSRKEWEFGLQRIIHFPADRKPSERTYLLKTLAGCPITAWKIQKLLNITILEENSNFTENDIFLIFSMLTGGSRGYTTLFDFLQENWDTIKLRFENKTNLWDNMISSSTSVFTTQEGLDMVTKLYVERQGEFGSAEHIIEKSLKNIREETKWSDDNLPIIESWLDAYLATVNVEDKKFIGYEQ